MDKIKEVNVFSQEDVMLFLKELELKLNDANKYIEYLKRDIERLRILYSLVVKVSDEK